jgi:hypothetical protein
MSTVIAKNNTGSTVDIQDIGISLGASEVINLTTFYKMFDLVNSTHLRSLVSSGTVGINNGTSDLGIADALNHLNIESEYEDLIQDADMGVTLTALPYCGVIRTSTVALTNTYANIIYQTVQLQNYTTILEWLVANPERITVKQAGLYRVYATCLTRGNTPTYVSSYFRVMRNGVQISSENRQISYATEIQQACLDFSIYLAVNDVITVQARTDTGQTADVLQSEFHIQREDGIQGADGPPGGTTIVTKDDGVQVTTNTAELNFRGSFIITDAGSNRANIDLDIVGLQNAQRVIQVYNSVGNINVNSLTPTPMPFDVQDIRDSDTYTWSSTVNNSRIYILRNAWYNLSYSLYFFGDNNVKTITVYIRENGVTEVPRTRNSGNSFRNGDPYGSTQMSGVLIPLHIGDYIELMYVQSGSAGIAYTQPGSTWIGLKTIRAL